MRFFQNIHTLEELRSEYRKLLKKYHPDNQGGSEELTKALNAEYEEILKNLEKGASAENKKHYNMEEDEALRATLEKIINLDITIEVCGNWIWATGNTYAFKDTLKETGFKWSKNKQAWYWHPEGYSRRGKKSYSMADIRDRHGSEIVKHGSDPKKLTA